MIPRTSIAMLISLAMLVPLDGCISVIDVGANDHMAGAGVGGGVSTASSSAADSSSASTSNGSTSGSGGQGGAAPIPTGDHLWSRIYGDASGEQIATAIATDASGNVIVAGTFSGAIDLGSGSVMSNGTDAFVAKLDPLGSMLWSRTFTGLGSQIVGGVATDAAGNVIVIGTTAGSASFGGPTLTSAGSQDVYVVKLDASGAHQWSKLFGDAADQVGYGIAVTSSGDIAIAGTYGGTIDLGSGAMTSKGFGSAFVARLDGKGNPQWSHSYGETGTTVAIGVTFDPAGDVLWTGQGSGAIDLGQGITPGMGGQDVLVAKLSTTGSPQWGKRYGDPSDQFGHGIATDKAGNVVVVGGFAGSINFGGSSFNAGTTRNGFAVKIDATGEHLWSRAYGDSAGIQYLNGVAIDHLGYAIVVGGFAGSLDAGNGTTLTSAGSDDVVAIKLDAAGSTSWAHRYGDSAEQFAYAVAVDSTGSVVLCGSVMGAIDLGGGALTSAGGRDAWVAKLAP